MIEYESAKTHVQKHTYKIYKRNIRAESHKQKRFAMNKILRLLSQKLNTLINTGFCFLVIALVGCNSGDSSQPEAQSTPIDESGPITVCANTPGTLPDSNLIWSDFGEYTSQTAEVLAMESSGDFAANETTYNSIVAELNAIRSQFNNDPTVEVQATPCAKLDSLILQFDDAAFAEIESGNYDDWVAINEQYGVDDIQYRFVANGVVIFFRRHYYPPTLIELYQQESLTGLQYIERNSIIGTSQDICLEQIDANERVYIFVQGEGDCPAGCISKTYSGYLVSASGNIQHLGTHSNGDDEPQWFSQRRECRSFLF